MALDDDASAVINGILVVRTGLPSFIVTLATLFIIARPVVGPHLAGHQHHLHPDRAKP